MNREIKFRGKRVNSGEWVFGYLFVDEDLDEYFIQGYNYYRDECGEQREPYWYKVIPETVGQYTGLKDKNSVEIYEGDIVAVFEPFNIPQIAEVRLNDGCYDVVGITLTFREYLKCFVANHAIEVIGNIHER